MTRPVRDRKKKTMASAYGVENASVTYGDTLAQQSGGLALGQPNQNGGILKKGGRVHSTTPWLGAYLHFRLE